MATESSSIDDLLLAPTAGNPPSPPEDSFTTDVQPESEIDEAATDKSGAVAQESDTHDEVETNDNANEDVETDDYGNVRAAPKTYTEDQVNDRINQAVRDRLSRAERNTGQQQPNQAQVQSAAQQGFEYNSESTESWQQQLEGFVEQTVQRMNQKQAHQAYQLKEQQTHAEFENKFRQGMSKFDDFVQVVGQQPITNEMTLASRGMRDPAAFFYAASKRAPQELQRISQISDPYAQMVEIGKLEERMKKPSNTTTKTPKPITRVKEDASIHHKEDKEPSIEQRIADDAKRRLALRDSRRRR